MRIKTLVRGSAFFPLFFLMACGSSELESVTAERDQLSTENMALRGELESVRKEKAELEALVDKSCPQARSRTSANTGDTEDVETTFKELTEMVDGGEMEVGERFTFRACIEQHNSRTIAQIAEKMASTDDLLKPCDGPELSATLDFDDPGMHKEFLKLGDNAAYKDIVVSMGPNERLMLHDMH